MDPDDDCASFSTKLEQQLQFVTHNYPEKLKAAAYWDLLKGRFFHGIPDNIRTNIRGLFNTPDMDYYQLLAAAREIEGERIVPKKPVVSTATSQDKTDKGHKPKPKVSAVQVADPELKKLERAWSQTSNDLQEMQKTLKDLTTAMGRLQQASTTTTSAPAHTATGGAEGGSDSSNSNSPRGRGGWRSRGSFPRSRGSFGRGSYFGGRPPQCWWCKDKVSTEQAQHLLMDCPLYEKVRNNWWTGAQGQGVGTTPASTAAATPPPPQGN